MNETSHRMPVSAAESDVQPTVPPQPTPNPAPTPEGAQEYGGREGPEPTRYGDWEKNGRCIDF